MKRSSFRICFKYTKINKRKSRFNETDVLVFLLHNKLILVQCIWIKFSRLQHFALRLHLGSRPTV